jgi:hypothetical protein
VPSKRKPSAAATRSDLMRVRRELVQVRTLATATAMALDVTRRECEASVRRCGELQNEIDNLKKLFQPS